MEKKLSIDEMMASYVDLSSAKGPVTRRGFQKTLHEVEAHSDHRSSSFVPSTRATDWNSVSGSLEGLFTGSAVPTLTPAPAASVEPVGMKSEGSDSWSSYTSHPTQSASKDDPTTRTLPSFINGPIPAAYVALSDSLLLSPDSPFTDPARVYPLLLQTGLSRDVLATIWSVVNRSTPGALTVREFHEALALVGLVQTGSSISAAMDHLGSLTKSPPIPKFTSSMPHPLEGVVTSSDSKVNVQPLISALPPTVSSDTFVEGPSTATRHDDDDFGDFLGAGAADNSGPTLVALSPDSDNDDSLDYSERPLPNSTQQVQSRRQDFLPDVLSVDIPLDCCSEPVTSGLTERPLRKSGDQLVEDDWSDFVSVTPELSRKCYLPSAVSSLTPELPRKSYLPDPKPVPTDGGKGDDEMLLQPFSSKMMQVHLGLASSSTSESKSTGSLVSDERTHPSVRVQENPVSSSEQRLLLDGGAEAPDPYSALRELTLESEEARPPDLLESRPPPDLVNPSSPESGDRDLHLNVSFDPLMGSLESSTRNPSRPATSEEPPVASLMDVMGAWGGLDLVISTGSGSRESGDGTREARSIPFPDLMSATPPRQNVPDLMKNVESESTSDDLYERAMHLQQPDVAMVSESDGLPDVQDDSFSEFVSVSVATSSPTLPDLLSGFENLKASFEGSDADSPTDSNAFVSHVERRRSNLEAEETTGTSEDKYSAFRLALDINDACDTGSKSRGTTLVQTWERVVGVCVSLLTAGAALFQGAGDESSLLALLAEEKAVDYLKNLREVYLVSKRVFHASKVCDRSSDMIRQQEIEADGAWNVLRSLLEKASVQEFVQSLPPFGNSAGCGVCLLATFTHPSPTPHYSLASNQQDVPVISFNGRNYHCSCANLWINRLDHILPTLVL